MKIKKIKNKTVAGVDIGTYSVKVIEALCDSSNKYILEKFSVKDIPSGANIDTIASVLSAAIADAKVSVKDLNIALSGPSALVRFINLPEMNEQDLKNSLRYEADRYIPFSLDEVNIDSFILGRQAETKGKMRVLIAAAKKDFIAKQLNLFDKVGYGVNLIDIGAFAAFNALMASNVTKETTNSMALLNLGHTYTNVVIFKNDTPYFTRDIQIGGAQIINSILKDLKKDEGSVNDVLNEFTFDEKTNQKFKSALSQLSDEVRLSFGYYENQFGNSIEKVFITGGLARISYLTAGLGENLGVKTEIWDPLSFFNVSSNVDKKKLDLNKLALSVAAGLAIRTD